jgi:hypothetical protein
MQEKAGDKGRKLAVSNESHRHSGVNTVRHFAVALAAILVAIASAAGLAPVFCL